MSSSSEASYELERQRKRELYLSRIRENTSLYLEKYTQLYNEYVSKGYHEVLQEEMKNLKNDLEYIRKNLNSNPELARDESFNVKKYIYALKGFYKNAIQEKAKIEKIRREKEALEKEAKKNEELKKINNAIKEIKNPIQREIAYDLFLQLKQNIKNNNNLNIDKEIEKIKDLSLEESKKFQQQHKKEELSIELEKVQSAPKEIIKEIEKSLQENNVEEAEKLVEKAEQEIMDERIRKETVKALYKTLKEDGFLVEKPKIINGEVIIKAQKPSGNRAYCKVLLDGKFTYKFDNYKGDACKKDIDKFKKDLDKIYGVKIEDKKVTWQNPDMVYKDGIKAVSEDERYL